ncbi:MAG: Hsp20/alpha crystallin family protein [Leptolyngbyaceae bacterium]|nr:Hsp20/alpha crystallin family protein [Leptolyngbyaceae bacterium]
MALVRWNPTREIDTLQREMNRLFDDVFSSSQRWNGVSHYVPAAELEESADAYALRLELPGINKDDLDVQVTAEAVTVTGERKMSHQPEDEGRVRSEFRYGAFQRIIPLPGRIDHQRVAADYNNGILILTLPKADEEKNKVVKVNIG